VSLVLERSARGLLELLELLDSGMKPPICRSCWKREWNHVCKDQSLAENERPTPAPSLSLLPYRVVPAAQQQPIIDLRAMDDANFRVAYNAVMAEYMRRRRSSTRRMMSRSDWRMIEMNRGGRGGARKQNAPPHPRLSGAPASRMAGTSWGDARAITRKFWWEFCRENFSRFVERRVRLLQPGAAKAWT
jgi:hypothetical protein